MQLYLGDPSLNVPAGDPWHVAQVGKISAAATNKIGGLGFQTIRRVVMFASIARDSSSFSIIKALGVSKAPPIGG